MDEFWQIGPRVKVKLEYQIQIKGRRRPRSEEPAQDLWERQVKEFEWKPLDQEVLISCGPELSAGFLCIFSDAETS